MSLDNFFVVRHRGHWLLRHLGQERGAFPSKEAALEAAIAAAKEAGEAGQEAFVYFQENTLQAPRIVWTYGKDPDPGE